MRAKDQEIRPTTWHWRMRARVYSVVRRLFVHNVNPNEDFTCVTCCKPLLRRVLYCSSACFERSCEYGR